MLPLEHSDVVEAHGDALLSSSRHLDKQTSSAIFDHVRYSLSDSTNLIYYNKLGHLTAMYYNTMANYASIK